MTLKSKFNLASASLILIVVIGMMGSLYFFEKKQIWNDIESQQNQDLAKLARVFDESMIASNELILINYAKTLILSPKVAHAGYINRSGSGWVYQGSSNSLELVKASDKTIQEIKNSMRILRRETKNKKGEEIIELSRPVQGRGYVRLAYSKDVVRKIFHESLSQLLRRFSIVGFIAILFGLMMATFFSSALARPIRRLMKAAEAIGKGKKGVQIRETGGDELGRLTKTFNNMSQELTKLDELKDEFMSHITHELRSPLTSIIATVELLDEMKAVKKDPKLTRSVGRLVYGSERLNKLVDNILDLTRMEAGKMHYDIQPFNIKKVMVEMANFFEPRAADKNLFIKVKGDENLPMVSGDVEKIRQVFSNLIFNAIKFTNEGGISLSAKVKDNMVEVRIRDTGVGIPPEKIDSVFEKFQTLDDTRNKMKKIVPGSGLGLNIVKNSIEAQGGSVRVESEVDEGSSFIFTLNLAFHHHVDQTKKEGSPEIPAIVSPTFKGKRPIVLLPKKEKTA